MNEGRGWGAQQTDVRSALGANLSPASSHTQGLCVYTVPPSLNRRRLAGPHLSAYTHPQSIVVSGRCWLAYWSTILWCLCADNAIYWPHKSAGFIKGKGDFEQQINEIKRWRRRGGGGGGGCANFSRWHCEAVIETEVVSHKLSLNWNVTITVGVISLSLPGLTCTFTFIIQIFREGSQKEDPCGALAC